MILERRGIAIFSVAVDVICSSYSIWNAWIEKGFLGWKHLLWNYFGSCEK